MPPHKSKPDQAERADAVERTIADHDYAPPVDGSCTEPIGDETTSNA
jgi:hypothetical protein